MGWAVHLGWGQPCQLLIQDRDGIEVALGGAHPRGEGRLTSAETNADLDTLVQWPG